MMQFYYSNEVAGKHNHFSQLLKENPQIHMTGGHYIIFQ